MNYKFSSVFGLMLVISFFGLGCTGTISDESSPTGEPLTVAEGATHLLLATSVVRRMLGCKRCLALLKADMGEDSLAKVPGTGLFPGTGRGQQQTITILQKPIHNS